MSADELVVSDPQDGDFGWNSQAGRMTGVKNASGRIIVCCKNSDRLLGQRGQSPCGHADELRLGVTACLPVETAQHAARGAAFVVLNEVGSDAGLGVAGGVVGLDEIAARIAEDDGFDDLDVGNLG